MIAHERQQNRKRESDQNPVKTDDKRVFNRDGKLVGIEILDKMLESYELTPHNPLSWIKIFKRHNNSAKRQISKTE